MLDLRSSLRAKNRETPRQARKWLSAWRTSVGREGELLWTPRAGNVGNDKAKFGVG